MNDNNEEVNETVGKQNDPTVGEFSWLLHRMPRVRIVLYCYLDFGFLFLYGIYFRLFDR